MHITYFVSVVSSTTLIIVRIASWNFDGNANNLNNTYNGGLSVGAVYNNVTYFGTVDVIRELFEVETMYGFFT